MGAALFFSLLLPNYIRETLSTRDKPRLFNFTPLCISTHQTTDNTSKPNQPFIHKWKISKRSSRDKSIKYILGQLIFNSIQFPGNQYNTGWGAYLASFFFSSEVFSTVEDFAFEQSVVRVYVPAAILHKSPVSQNWKASFWIRLIWENDLIPAAWS